MDCWKPREMFHVKPAALHNASSNTLNNGIPDTSRTPEQSHAVPSDVIPVSTVASEALNGRLTGRKEDTVAKYSF